MTIQPWKRVEPTTVHQMGWRAVVLKTFQVPDSGEELSFMTYYKEKDRSAAVIAVTPDHKVIVARQFRQGPERIMNELPGGGVQADEDPAEAAKRELLEETGYQVGSIEFLGTGTVDAYTNNQRYYYFATDCTPSPDGAQPEEYEIVETVLMTIPEFIANAKNDGTTDAGAVLLAYDRLLALTEAS